MKKIFSIKGMHCNSCANLIENELKNKVNHISVNFSKEQAEIDFNENKISENEIKEVIKKLGYELNNTDKIHKPKEDRVPWIPIAIAGFIHPVFAEIAMALSSITVITNANLLRRQKI